MLEKSTLTRLSTLLLAAVCAGVSTSAHAAPTAKTPAQSEAMTFAHNMGIGWNLGNTLEATGGPAKTTVSDYETLWGNPVTTRAMIDGIKKSGFNTIRIPVAWSNLMGPNYQIDPKLMARVKEVAGYALDNKMYVIINIHWDGGWITKFPLNYGESMAKYKSVWTQISDNFKDYSDHVIFESLNEESDFSTFWNHYSNQPGEKLRAYNLLNLINQSFTNVVRASKGNNSQRYLMMAGYVTDIALTVDPAFKMPRDPAKHSMVSVHYYSPATFTLLEKDASWGKVKNTWGTPEEVEAIKTDMAPLKTRFIDQGIPVVLGEFGFNANKDSSSAIKYLSTVAVTAYSLGVVPVFWDAGSFYNRRELKWNSPQIGDALASVIPDYNRSQKAP